LIDEELKRKFRSEKINIVEMSQSKAAIIPKDTKILQPLQSDEEFEKLLHVKNWGITQTIESSVLFFDSDPKDVNDFNKKFSSFFNRRRDKYIKNSLQVNSQHGFLKVTDADHDWCVEFARKYHLKSGIEIYAENHWGIFAGTYYNEKNTDDPKRETIWFSKDDLHKDPIIEVTKEDLTNVFGVIQLDNSISAPNNIRVDEIIKDNFIVNEGQDRERFIIKYMVSRIIKNPEFLDNNKILLEIAHEFNKKHCNPSISDERLEKTIKQSINYALTNLKNKGLIQIEKSVTFDLDDEHKLIINNAFKSINKLKKDKEKVNYDSLLPLIVKYIEDEDSLHDYMEGGKNHSQLQELVSLIVKNSQDEVEFLQAYLETKIFNRFAHVMELDVKNQFNCWYWTGKRWSDNTAHYVLTSLQKLKGEKIKPTSSIATSISNKISASEKTLQIDLTNKKYQEESMMVITNSEGQYFDIRNGTIKKVDPSIMFYFEPQIKLNFTEDIEEPTKFLAFLKERFQEEDIDLILDHLSSIFLHTTILGVKPKMLFIKGKTDTFKSLIIEILKYILTTTSITKVSNEQLSDKFGLDLIADALLNYSEEQNAVEPKDPASLKDATTMESGYVSRKYSIKQVFASRFPKHIVMCNKIAPIAQDDDPDSIFNRNEYVEINDVTNDTPDWRKEILKDNNEIQRICMYLLRRASDIFNKRRVMKQQSIQESREKYVLLTQGTITDFLSKKYTVIEPQRGVLFSYFLADFNKYTGENTSNKACRKLLEDQGYEVEKIRVFQTKENVVFTEDSTGYEPREAKQKTMILGIRPNDIVKKSRPNDNTSQIKDGLKF